jgi:hypothetical protein
MVAEGTSTAFILSAVCFLLTFGSCFVIPTVGTEMGLLVGYDVFMPMMVGAYCFLPLGCISLLGGLVGSFFPSKDEDAEEEKEQNKKRSISIYWIFFVPILTFILFFIALLSQGAI